MGERDRDAHTLDDPVGADDAERARLAEVYGGYHASGRPQDRWSPDASGNRCILAERQAQLVALLDALPPRATVLEVGCGAGEVLSQLRSALPADATVVGVDVLEDRLGAAADRGELVAVADGRRLPFEDDRFDVVAFFTVFSSVPDADLRRELAAEATRVLASEGTILWYEMRVQSTNREVRPIGRHAVQDLFPACELDLVSISVLPPLARRLGRFDRRLYPVLARLPFLRTHYLGLLRQR